MPTGRCDASALCLQSRPEAVLVVGGDNAFSSQVSRCAELLIHTAPRGRGGGGAWRWRKLKKMHQGRDERPGMLLLQAGGDRQRVLVAGGNRSTAEILHVSCRDRSDCGQWTRIAPLSDEFYSTFLVECSNRIFVIGSFLACTKPFFAKDYLLHLLGLLDDLRNVNELTTSAPGQLTVRKILKSRIPFSVLFAYLFCFSPSWRLLNPLLGGLWRDCGMGQFTHLCYAGNELFTFSQASILYYPSLYAFYHNRIFF